MRCGNAYIRSWTPSFILLVILLIFASQTPLEPQIFLPMPAFRPIPVSIPSSVCSSPQPFLGLMLVLSHPGNLVRRNVMRSTYPVEEIERLGFRRLFVLGTVEVGIEDDLKYREVNATDKAIQAEIDQHGDIMQLNHPERYDDLILKSYGAFKWATEHCPHARFIVKNDDDMFFDYYQMELTLKRVPEWELDIIFGNVIVDTWNLTPYLAGGTYLMSPRTMETLVDAVTNVQPPIRPFVHLAEDVYFTGLVAERIGVLRTDLPVIRSWIGLPYCCSGSEGQVYQCEYSVFMQKPWKLQIELLLRYKEHGRKCYNFHCARYVPTLLERNDVSCFRE